MFSKTFKEEYYPQIQSLLEQKTRVDSSSIKKILKKDHLNLNDINNLIQSYPNQESRNLIIKTAAQKREKLWKNRLFLVPPLYVTDKCAKDCLYCPWRKSNKPQRRSLTTQELKKELNFLIDTGYNTIQLVGASDPSFSADKIAEYIKIAKEKLKDKKGHIGINFESTDEKDYKLFINSGLDFASLWQETYHPKAFKKMHPKSRKSNFDYRLDAFDRAFRSGLKKVGIAFLGRLYDWKFELLSLIAHGTYLKQKYKIDPFIIGTPRLINTDKIKINNPSNFSDDEWLFAVSILKLAFPRSLPWFSTRASFNLNKKAAQGGGALFTLDCSTAVGGYTIKKDFPQFPVYSKSLDKGIKWLKQQGYKPEFHLPY